MRGGDRRSGSSAAARDVASWGAAGGVGPSPRPPGTGADPPDPTPTAPAPSDLEHALASVAGVRTATVHRTAEGRDRLRISLAPGADPASVSCALAATLRERFGIALDPARIVARPTVLDGSSGPVAAADGAVEAGAAAGPATTVAPEGDDRGHARAPAADLGRHATAAASPAGLRYPRAAIGALVARPEGDDLAVAATLRLWQREATGYARGLDTGRGRSRAIAEATLAALAELSGNGMRSRVDHVTVLAFPDLAHVTASVTLWTDRGEEPLLGAALVRDDPDRAVMRATLDAVNRRVAPWLAAGPD